MIRSVFFLLAGLFMGISALAQSETFDIVTYSPPQNWKKEVADFAVSYVITNNQSGGWCRINIYKSIKSSGDPLYDFNSEWNNLISKNHSGTTMPKPEMETEDGWTSYSGATPFQFESTEAYALLSTISGYGVEVSIMVLMNSQEFMHDVEKVLSSLTLKKPEGQLTKDSPVTSSPSQAGLTVTAASGNQGISTSTTNFDDGCMARPFADYVRVTKGSITVLLHYGIEITDELRNTGDVEGNLFDRLMQPRYVVSNIRKFDNGGPCYFCIYFYEADVVEKATGKKYYAGFRVLTESGVSRCVEILSPSKPDFQKEFPTQEKIAALPSYNKFAVTRDDLVGTWENSSGSYVNMYNTVTGSYAGMATASSSHTFIFNSDGTYQSRHVGAHGMVGSLTTFDQKYNGKFTVTNWDITMTNRWQGKTEGWWAQFEAVRGGRILHITDKSAPAMQYHLVKTK